MYFCCLSSFLCVTRSMHLLFFRFPLVEYPSSCHHAFLPFFTPSLDPMLVHSLFCVGASPLGPCRLTTLGHQVADQSKSFVRDEPGECVGAKQVSLLRGLSWVDGRECLGWCGGEVYAVFLTVDINSFCISLNFVIRILLTLFGCDVSVSLLVDARSVRK